MNINTLSFEDILSRALTEPSVNYYAYSLAKSRHQQPSHQTIQATIQLIQSQGDQWLQVLSRQTINNLSLSFGHCIYYPTTYVVLLPLINPHQNKGQLASIIQKILVFMELRQLELHQRWTIFAALLDCVKEYEEESLKLMDVIGNFIVKNNSFVQDMQQLYDLHVNSSHLQLSNSNFTSVFRIQSKIIHLFKKATKSNCKRMNYLQFAQQHTQTIQWIKNILMCVITTIEQLNVQSVTGSKNISEELYQDALCCLALLCNIYEISDLLEENSERLAKYLALKPIVIGAVNQSIESKVSYQFGLILEQKQFGIDIATSLVATTLSLARNIPSFLQKYIVKIEECQSTLDEGDILFKLSFLHKQYKQREDLLIGIIQPFIEHIFRQIDDPTSTNSFVSQLYCRKIRLLFLYCDLLKKTYFDLLIQRLVSLLKVCEQNTFGFTQAVNLMQQLIDTTSQFTSSNTLSRKAYLLKEYVPQICIHLMDLIQQIFTVGVKTKKQNYKLLKLCNILHAVTLKNQSQSEKINASLIMKLTEWLPKEVDRVWQLGLTHNAIIMELVAMLKTNVNLIKDSYYFDLAQPIVEVLQYLSHPKYLQIVDQLLQILCFVLDFQKNISPGICEVIVGLGNIVNRANGNIFEIRNVLKSLCAIQISHNILFNCSELIRFLFNMFIVYFSNFVDSRYIDLYCSEWKQNVTIFQKYIDTYEQYLNQNNQTRNNVLMCVLSMPENEYKLQLLLLLNHQQTILNHYFYQFQMAQKYNMRKTYKLIYIKYIDQLIKNYNQILLNQLVQFHALHQLKNTQRQLENDQFGTMPILQSINVTTYMNKAMSKLRSDNKIDQMEYNSLVLELELKE